MNDPKPPFQLSPDPEPPPPPPPPPESGSPAEGEIVVPPPPAPARGDGPLVAPPAPPPGPGASSAGSETAGTRVAAFLARVGPSPVVLAGAALALAGLGSVLFLLFHPRLGALAGLVAVAASQLSLLSREDAPEDHAFARALAPPVDLLLMGGLLGLAVGHFGSAVALLTLLALLLIAWLPQLEGDAAPGGGTALWLRADRMLVVLAGTLLGSFVVGLVVAAAMGLLDAWVRLEHLHDPRRPGGPSFLRPLLQPDGSLVPAVRWGSLAIAVLLLILLERGEGWPF